LRRTHICLRLLEGADIYQVAKQERLKLYRIHAGVAELVDATDLNNDF
jgi:hypothetical protein